MMSKRRNGQLSADLQTKPLIDGQKTEIGRLANHFGYDIPPVTGWRARLTSLCISV
jgi:hypothetical protein